MIYIVAQGKNVYEQIFSSTVYITTLIKQWLRPDSRYSERQKTHQAETEQNTAKAEPTNQQDRTDLLTKEGVALSLGHEKGLMSTRKQN